MDLLWGLALLACPVGMGVMMWLMMRGSRAGGTSQGPPESATDGEVARLRREVEDLRADRHGDTRNPAGRSRA